MFTVLIMAGSFLFELTRYLSEGIDPLLILQLTVVLLPGIMAKTFPMAVLLSGLLAFGRLSSDSEIVAIKAAGVSVARIMVPVALFGIVVTVATFLVNEKLVPSATQRAVGLKDQFESQLTGKTAKEMSKAIYQEGKLTASFWAKDFSFSDRTLRGVVITTYGADELPTAYLYVDTLEYTSDQDWVMKGGVQVSPADAESTLEFTSDNVWSIQRRSRGTTEGSESRTGGSNEEPTGKSFVKFESAWPSNVPMLDASPEELLAKTLTDLDALPMEAMGHQIAKLKKSPEQTSQLRSQIANLEFGYWNKIALPLAALVFGLVGAPIGIRSHRVPASAGYWIAVIIIIAYLVLARVMAIYAQGGRVPAIVASFLPIVIGLVVAGILVHRRNN